jgi:hypothetical protein
MSTTAATMIMKAPTMVAPIIVLPASVLNHFRGTGSGGSAIGICIGTVGSLTGLPPGGSSTSPADRTAVCRCQRFERKSSSDQVKDQVKLTPG